MSEQAKLFPCFNLKEGFETHCKAGVPYSKFKVGEGNWLDPCYSRDPSQCESYRAYTDEEIQKGREEVKALLEKIKKDWAPVNEEEG